MSILVNPFTEKLAGKFAKTKLVEFVQQGKRLYKSIFGTPEAIKKQLAHNPYKPKTSIFEGNNPAGETAEQLLAKLSEKHGYKAVKVGKGQTIYVPSGNTAQMGAVKSLTHEPPVHTTISPTKIELNTAKSLKAELEKLVKRDENGVLISSKEECEAILQKLDPAYLRKIKISFNKEVENIEMLRKLPVNDIRRKMAGSKIYQVIKPPSARDIINRYSIRLENDITKLQYKYNQETTQLTQKTNKITI